jgi:hypothetical protein
LNFYVFNWKLISAFFSDALRWTGLEVNT